MFGGRDMGLEFKGLRFRVFGVCGFGGREGSRVQGSGFTVCIP